MQKIVCAVLLFTLAACVDGRPDYESSATCHERGYDAGTPAFDKCVKDERQQRLMEQTRAEFEQRRANEEYDRSSRGFGRPF